MLLELIIGIGITAFLLVYFGFQWDKEHFLLKLLISFIFIALLLLLPKAIIDNPDTCDIVLANKTNCWHCCNSTTIYDEQNATNTTICLKNGTIEQFHYTEYCVTNTKNTHIIWYNILIWFLRLFVLYICLYFLYVFWLKSKLMKFIGRGT